MSLGIKVLRGSAAMLVVTGLQSVLGLASTLLLARLLAPTDFGVVAIAFLVLHMSAIVCETGARQYLIQTAFIDSNTINTAWTLDIAFRALGMLLIFLCLPLTLRVWDEPATTLAIAVLAPTMLLEAFLNPQLHVDLRELKYSRVVRVNLTQKLVSFVVVIAIAWWQRSFWAIIIGTYASVLTGIVVSYAIIDYRPRLSYRSLVTQWRFSKWILLRGYLGYLRAEVDLFLVSKWYPLFMVGQFSMARELTVLPARQIIMPITQPLLSSFSRVRDDPATFSRHVSIALLAVSLLVSPVCVYLFVHAVAVVDFVLGEKWQRAGPLLQAMMPLLLAYSLGGPINSMLIARGWVRGLFVYDAISLSVVVMALGAAGRFELIDFVWVRSAIGIGTALVVLMIISYLVGLRIRTCLSVLLAPLALAVVATMLGRLVTPATFRDGAVLNGVLFGLSYVGLVLATGTLLRSRSPAWTYLYNLTVEHARNLYVRFCRQPS